MRLGTLARLFGWLSHVLGDDRERCIFGFWDGTRWRRVDPLSTWRVLESDQDFNPTRDALLVENGDPDAVVRAVAAVRRSFGVPVFDGTVGLTETECLLLLGDFWEFCGDLKKKASPMPTLQPPTEPAPSDASTTPSDSDCGSVSDASTPEPALP